MSYHLVKKNKWSIHQLAYLENNFDRLSNKQLAEAIGKTPGQVSWQLARKGWRRSGIKRWTKEEIEFIKANVSLGEPALAKALNTDRSKIRSVLRNHKIRTGNDSQFKKGMNPWNAGRHIRMSPKSEFKKGQLPSGTLYDGAIRTRKDKTGLVYKWIRINQSNWQLLHRVTWQKHNGPIPKGFIITFVDGDPLNCHPDNLRLISRKDNMMRNQNRVKASQSMRSAWEEGVFYENNHYIATRITSDKELQNELLKNPEIIELKRTQLLARREAKTLTKSI